MEKSERKGRQKGGIEYDPKHNTNLVANSPFRRFGLNQPFASSIFPIASQVALCKVMEKHEIELWSSCRGKIAVFI